MSCSSTRHFWWVSPKTIVMRPGAPATPHTGFRPNWAPTSIPAAWRSLLLSSFGDACALFESELRAHGFALDVFARRRFINETLTILRATPGRAPGRAGMTTERLKVVLYNPRSVFYTMPLALLAIGSELDPATYEVDHRRRAPRSGRGANRRVACSTARCASASPCSPARRFPTRCAFRAPPRLPGPIFRWSGAAGTRRCSAGMPARGLRRRHGAGAGRGDLRGDRRRASRRVDRSTGAWAACSAAPTAACTSIAPRAAAAARPLPAARLRADSRRALLRAQGQAPARLHLVPRLQLPLRVLLRSVRLWPQMGRHRAGLDGGEAPRAVGRDTASTIVNFQDETFFTKPRPRGHDGAADRRLGHAFHLGRDDARRSRRAAARRASGGCASSPVCGDCWSASNPAMTRC